MLAGIFSGRIIQLPRRMFSIGMMGEDVGYLREFPDIIIK